MAIASPAAGAVAQQRDSAAADSANVPVYRLEGITVTVARTRERLDKLPYAVGLLSAAQLQGYQPTISLDESLIEIPGVFVYNRYNFALGNRISIRGFGSRAQFGVRGIRIVQDGIPLTMADGQSQLNNLDLAAAGRVEVIRGPAASLYGNASGGVISVTTEPAPPQPFGAELRVLGGGYGNDQFYGKLDLKGAGQSGKLDYVAHLSHFRSDGYRLHSRVEYTLFNTRVRFRPDDGSILTAVINYANTPWAENPSSLTDSLARVKPDTARDLVLTPAECPPDPGFGGCQNLGETSEQGQAGLTYRRWLGGGHEISIMGYGLFRDLDNPIPFTLILLDRRAAGTRAEYRYSRPTGPLSGLTLGIDFDYQGDGRLEFFRNDQGVGPLEVDQDETVRSLGLFAYTRWRLTRPLELTASLRYDRVRFEVDDHLVSEGDPDDSGSRTLVQPSPMVGLTYRHAPWLNLYGNVGRSFQTPTTTEFTDVGGGFNPNLEPETATNYEIGLKGTLAGRLSYSLALYLADVEAQIIGFQAPGTERTVFRNAGTSRWIGIEADISALLAEGLMITAAYTRSDYEFIDFETDAGDFSGNVVPGIPPHQLHGRLTYTHPSKLSATVQVTAVDTYFVDSDNENTNDGRAIVDLRFAYAPDRIGRSIAPFLGINNLFDVRSNSSTVVNALGGRYYEPAPGRNVYAGLRLRLP